MFKFQNTGLTAMRAAATVPTFLLKKVDAEENTTGISMRFEAKITNSADSSLNPKKEQKTAICVMKTYLGTYLSLLIQGGVAVKFVLSTVRFLAI